VFWLEHFSYYPFTFDREDQRSARLVSAIINDGRASRASWAGKSTFQVMDAKDLIPDYLGSRNKVSREKTLEQQQAEFSAFAQKIKSMTGK
jgi:hypothetical protein